MKTLITSLIMTITASTAMAQSEPANVSLQRHYSDPMKVTNDNSVGRSAWITIYAFNGGISEARCLPAGDTRQFAGYNDTLSYQVRAEVKETENCGGSTLNDVSLIMSGVDHAVLSKDADGRLAFDDVGNSEQDDAVPFDVLAVRNEESTGHSVWVTIYNGVGNISDTGCVRPGKRQLWNNYYPVPSYTIRTEVKENLDCGGGNVADMRVSARNGDQVNAYKDGNEYKLKFHYAP